MWDDTGHTPSLKTEADWISSGEIVFDKPIGYGGLLSGLPRKDLYIREPSFYEKTGTRVAADGKQWPLR